MPHVHRVHQLVGIGDDVALEPRHHLGQRTPAPRQWLVEAQRERGRIVRCGHRHHFGPRLLEVARGQVEKALTGRARSVALEFSEYVIGHGAKSRR